jgi:hypothetical protein
MRVLHVGVEGIAVLAGFPQADRAARLHEMRVDPADHIAPFDDVRGAGEGRLGRRLVAALEQIGDVVRALLPDRVSAGGRVGGVGDRREYLVTDVDQLGGVLGLRQSFRDDEGDRLAYIAHPPLGETEMGAPEHRRAVRPLALKRHPHPAHIRGGEVIAGVDRQHPGRGLRRGHIDPTDRRMRMRRAQHIGMGLAGQIEIVLEAAVAAEQPLVLEAPHRLPYSELAHGSISQLSCAGILAAEGALGTP